MTMTVEKHFASQLAQAQPLSRESFLVTRARKDRVGTQFKQGDRCVYFIEHNPENKFSNNIIYILNTRSLTDFETMYTYVKQSEMYVSTVALPAFAKNIGLSSNGTTSAFEAEDGGSNPPGPAKHVE